MVECPWDNLQEGQSPLAQALVVSPLPLQVAVARDTLEVGYDVREDHGAHEDGGDGALHHEQNQLCVPHVLLGGAWKLL